MDEWIDLLTSIAKEIRSEVLPIIGKPGASEEIWLKEVDGKRNRIDALAAKILLKRLKDSERSLILISEECGELRFGRNPKLYLIVDEVDGTTNATHDIPFYASSLAICDGPRILNATQGVVMNLANGDIYTAKRGGGAKKNGSKIHSSQSTELEEALLVLDAAPTTGATIKALIPLLRSCKHVRHYGAAALEICMLAEGKIDAFIDLRERLRITDVAAAFLILREAGGAAVGRPQKMLNVPLKHDEKVSFLAAGNQRLLKRIADKLD